jgi:hypothetical protein
MKMMPDGRYELKSFATDSERPSGFSACRMWAAAPAGSPMSCRHGSRMTRSPGCRSTDSDPLGPKGKVLPVPRQIARSTHFDGQYP